MIEDLHWVDPETQAALDSLVEGLSAARVLLVVSFRPEYAHPWARKSYYRQIPIEPLSAPQAYELTSLLIGHRDELGGLRTLLVERTEGNPFFLEENVRTWSGRGS